MTKSTKNIIIIAAVIALLAAGIVVLNMVDFSKNTDTETNGASETYTVYSAEADDLTEVSAESANGVIEAVKTDDGWTIKGADDVDGSKVYTLVSTVSSITSKNKVAENVTAFAQYGLEQPSATVVINGKDGENTLYIGDKSPTLGEYFIRLNDDTTVYTLYSYKVDTIMQPLSYYRDFNRFNINIDDVTSIKIERDDETIELKIADDIANTTNNVWELVEPYMSSANDEYIDSNILAKLDMLTLNTLAPAGGDYGTLSPEARVTLIIEPYDNTTGKYGSEYTETFSVGRTEGDKTYVEYNGKVYETEAQTLEFVGTPAFNLLNKLQALVDIATVKKVTVTIGSASNAIDIVHNGDDTSFRFNGAEADYKLTRSMYQAIISLAVDGEYKGETLGATFLEFDFDGVKDLGDVKIEFKSINDLSCALVKNGKAEFTIKKNKLNEFIGLWETYVNETVNGGK